MEIFSRVSQIIGEENLNKLKGSSVLVFGVGGVGGFVVEGLVRSGIGTIAVVDNDTVAYSNVNRQIIASSYNVGESKVDAIEKRCKLINPKVTIEKYKTFFLPDNSNQIDFTKYDYVVDAVDTITAKILIIEKAKENKVKVISSMGTAGKLDITKLSVCDIKDTSVCPLARVMRRELKKRGIEKVKVVYSNEESAINFDNQSLEKTKNNSRVAPPSMIFVPAVAGLMIANEVIKELIQE